MATLIQEIAGSASAWHGGDDDTFSMTFDLDFPPHGAFIKVVLGQFSNGAMEEAMALRILGW